MDKATLVREQGDVRREPTLDICRGATIILVIICHLQLYLRGSLAIDPVMIEACNWLGRVRMPLLFLISGLLSASLRNGPPCRAMGRAAACAWLFLLWAPAYMVACGTRSAVTMLVAPSGELWFIWGLGLLTALLPVTRRIDRRVLVIGSLIISTLTMGDGVSLPYADGSLMRNAFFFLVGALFRTEVLASLHGSARSAVALAVAAVFFSVADWPVGRAFGALLLTLGALRLARMASGVAPDLARALGRLGRNTLPIYLMHGLVIRLALIPLFWHGLPSGVGSTALSLGLIALLTTAMIAGCIAAREIASRTALRLMFTAPNAQEVQSALRYGMRQANLIRASICEQLAKGNSYATLLIAG